MSEVLEIDSSSALIISVMRRTSICVAVITSEFALSFAVGWAYRRKMAEATIAGLSGAYGNIGYMGPGLALATLGAAANVPVALIFCFDTLVLFALVPFLMTLAGPRQEGIAATAFEVVKRVVLHPFIIATALGGRWCGLAVEA